MERPYPAVEFESIITPEGMIVVPPAIAKSFADGQNITVRITAGVVAASLRKRGITEEIIETVAELQLEEREQVLEFFGAEGSLASATKFKQQTGKKRRSR